MLILKNVYKKKSDLKAKEIEPLLDGLVWLKEFRVSNRNAISALNTILGNENLDRVKGAKSVHVNFFTHKKTVFDVIMDSLDEIIRILELNDSEIEFTWDTSAKYFESLTRIAIIAKIDQSFSYERRNSRFKNIWNLNLEFLENIKRKPPHPQENI